MKNLLVFVLLLLAFTGWTQQLSADKKTVNGVPVSQYNALIYEGNICDSLIKGEKIRQAFKDSIIKNQSVILQSQNKLISIKDSTASDQKKENEILRISVEKSKKLTAKIPLIIELSIVGGIIIERIIFH